MPTCQEIATQYTNTKLRTLVNVYQASYPRFKSPGLGDFLRGSFCMLQLIDLVNKYCGRQLLFDMDIRNHAMARYFEVEPPNPRTKYGDMPNLILDIPKFN